MLLIIDIVPRLETSYRFSCDVTPCENVPYIHAKFRHDELRNMDPRSHYPHIWLGVFSQE